MLFFSNVVSLFLSCFNSVNAIFPPLEMKLSNTVGNTAYRYKVIAKLEIETNFKILEFDGGLFFI